MDARMLAEQLKEINAKMTKAPWAYNSYSAVFGIPVGEDDDEVLCVPVVAGDTATGQGSKDASGIAEIRNLLPNIIEALESQWIKITDDPLSLPQKVDIYIVIVPNPAIEGDPVVDIYFYDQSARTRRNWERVAYWREIGPVPAPPEEHQ